MKNIQGMMKTLFGSSCYCYCLAYIALKTDDIKVLTKAVLEGWYKGYIKDDGFVQSPIPYLKQMGLVVRDITKPTIKSLSELPNGLHIVEYKKSPSSADSHFVVCNKEGVVFDPSGSSITVATGKPFSFRRIWE